MASSWHPWQSSNLRPTAQGAWIHFGEYVVPGHIDLRLEPFLGTMRLMKCPRCSVELKVEHHRGIEVDHCPRCNGRWLDHHELDMLEATVTPEKHTRRATIEYAKRPSELACPSCGKQMRAFNYRAYKLELDTCEDEHGFWLDAGEEGRVRDIVEERVKGLARSASAEEAWGQFLSRVGQKSVWDKVKGMFGGRR